MPEQCVRGCVRPCKCEDCKAADEPIHPPVPVPPKEGLLCGRCAGRLEGWLTDVLDDTLRLDARRLQAGTLEGKGKHQKATGSPALVRLDVVALVDPRTTSVVTEDAEDYPENSEDQAVIAIPSRVCSWARLFAEDHDLESPTEMMAQAVSLLRAWWDTLVTESWVDDFYNDMEQIRRLLNNAHMVERPVPIGHCLSVYEVNGKMVACERPIYSQPNDKVVKCGRCGRVYRGLDKVRLKVAEGR